MSKRSIRIAACIGGLGNEYQTPLLKSITKACNSHDFKLNVFYSFADEWSGKKSREGDRSIYELVNFSQFDGLILFNITLQDPELVQDLKHRAQEEGLPVVCVDGAEQDCCNITINYDNAVEMMTRHFVEAHGFTKINYLGGEEEYLVSRIRREAYERVLRECGIPVEPSRELIGSFWDEPAYRAVLRYYSEQGEMPEAFVCANDEMAIGAVRALEQLGFRVPQDVCVSGLDGVSKALNFCPSITTAQPDLDAAGRLAVERLAQVLAGQQESSGQDHVGCIPHFQESCGCASFSGAVNSEVKEELYQKLEQMQHYLKWVNGSVESITAEETAQGVVDRLGEVAQQFWTGKCWFCVSDDFYRELFGMTGASPYPVKGFSNTIRTLVCCRDHILEQAYDFSRLDLLPNYDYEVESCGAILFVPMHFQDRIIGYIAVEYSDIVMDLSLLSNLVCSVSVVLENARIRVQLQKMIDQLQCATVRDPMTELMNRRGFYNHVIKLFAACAEEGAQFMSISLDLDGLKEINDTYGHQEGDSAIRAFARFLDGFSSDTCVVARFGGDEFVMAGRFQESMHPITIVHTLQSKLNEYNRTSGRCYRIEMSSGFHVGVPDYNSTVDEWIALADEQMYTEKKDHHRRSRVRR